MKSPLNPAFGTRLPGRMLKPGAVMLALLGLAGTTRAQGFGPDPYLPFNSQYTPFVYPIAPGPFDYGYNQAPTNGIRGANQFENFRRSLEGGPRATSRGGGAGTPYYQANRNYDQEFGRLYRPNQEADAKFQSTQEQVTELYFKFLREKDPKRRQQLFRDLNRARGRADRALAAGGPNNSRRPAQATRRATSAAADRASTSEEDRELSTGPPALPGARTRTRASRLDSGSGSTDGPPPLPGSRTRSRSRLLDGENPEDGPPDLSSRASRGSSRMTDDPVTSRLLDRDTSSNRPRISPRSRPSRSISPSQGPPPP
jgi:hypothetical protein